MCVGEGLSLLNVSSRSASSVHLLNLSGNRGSIEKRSADSNFFGVGPREVC